MIIAVFATRATSAAIGPLDGNLGSIMRDRLDSKDATQFLVQIVKRKLDAIENFGDNDENAKRLRRQNQFELLVVTTFSTTNSNLFC